jgi:nucleoside-diphosphate-sugar epimerase
MGREEVAMRALVTGGGGFLGGAILRRLRARGDDVQSFSRHSHAEVLKLGAVEFLGDLSDPAAIERAVDGCNVVFHVAAKAGVWGPYSEYHNTNVVGTENVLSACRKYGVRRLVYTSSPSVVFTGHDDEAIDETAPYATRFLASYPQTKAIAERAVLAANGPDIATVALRPHLVWGPGDNHLIPRLIARARTGKLRRIGNGKNRVDATYIDNAAEAHLLAADRLHPGSRIAGHAYFLAQDEPVLLWDFINRILNAAGLPPVRRSIPAALAYFAGATLEFIYSLPGISGEPKMTRFVASQLSTSHWFNLTAAKRDLGYAPTVTLEEGLRRLQEWFSKEPRLDDRDQCSERD